MTSTHLPRTRRSGSILGPLYREHGLARRALRVLEQQAEHVNMGGVLPESDIDSVVRFFRELFLGAHTDKKVGHLCPAIVLYGSDREAELVGTILRGHDDIRELLDSLSLFSAPLTDLAEEERQGFVETARACVRRLGRLMEEEENSLFPVALSCLPFDERLTLREDFDDLDRHYRSAESWHRELRDLEATWVN